MKGCSRNYYFFIVSSWNLEIIALYNVVPELAGFDTSLQNVMTVIVVCRCMLQLRKTDNPNARVTSRDQRPKIQGFKGTLSRLNQNLVDDFTDPFWCSRTVEDHLPNEGNPRMDSENLHADSSLPPVIDSKEFLWAISSNIEQTH
ncbi:hypothetical protein M422DRAFT_264706 [Sphaerobolus stellatus SS14]|uniref:Uncharacterized protein n=1 Tax=Sphaerobolus stellatus (strain SS14) TaxID=990650 RepID=A0A0C9UEY6_SPHS4|nr:hypothetical protein M422DRAFT_264706 [Sphaerobolus stellatus SS14]